MKRYSCVENPDLDGYIEYYEYEDDWVTRQINLFLGSVLLLEVPEASDARLSDAGHTPSEVITQAEFDERWEYYRSRPHGTKRTDSPLLKPPWFMNGDNE